ncbi:myelin expression factor 2-like [Sycon ciliatum]|uniref:myelin expression factor 2-like n=1 Tax=Sycon ciliatum TaxID=27933 RepID=UPI0020AA9A4D
MDGYLWDEMRLSAHEDRSSNYVRGMKSRVRHGAEGGGRGGERGRSRSPLAPSHGSRSGSSRSHHHHDNPHRGDQLSALNQLQQLNQLASLLTTGVAGRNEPHGDDHQQPNSVVFVSNIDYSYSWQRLKDLLAAAGRIRHVHLRTDGDGKSKGTATVEFDTHREAEKCVDMFNGNLVNGRALRIHIYRERDRDGAESVPAPPAALGDLLATVTGGSGGGGSGSSSSSSNPLNLLSTLTNLAALQQLTQSGSNSGVLSALSSHNRPAPSYHDSRHGRDGRDGRDGREDSYRRRDDRSRHDDRGRSSGSSRDYHGSDRASSRDHGHAGADYPYPSSSRSGPSDGGSRSNYPRIFVRNLDWGMDWQDVEDVFKVIGDVMHVDILREADGRSKGRATVSFRSIDDCYAAIDSLNGSNVRGRPIEVKLDHFTT